MLFRSALGWRGKKDWKLRSEIPVSSSLLSLESANANATANC